MSHSLEINNGMTSFAFAGQRQDVWHRLGQMFENGATMTVDEVMSLAHLDREVTVIPVPAPDGAQWAVDERGQSTAPHYVLLDGKVGVTPDGQLYEIPSKVVGLAGNQAAYAHSEVGIRDTLLYGEEAAHVTHGQAVWLTGGYLRDARQWFATMQAPPIIIDPNGIADHTNQYLTMKGSWDGSLATELGSSRIRVVCANTLAAHDTCKQVVIKVRATKGKAERLRTVTQWWAMAQDEAKALALQGERMLAVANGKQVLKGLCENVLGLEVKADMPKRQVSIREGKLGEIKALYHAPTNLPAVGDNGYAAYQTVVEYLDWFSPVKGDDQLAARLGNQFDGTHDKLKQRAADYVLSLV